MPRAIVRVSRGRRGELSSWVEGLLGRRPFNVVVAALAQAARSAAARPGPANELARIIWAMSSRGETYRVA